MSEPLITELKMLFSALADNTRLQIVTYLIDKGEATVQQISESIGKSQSLISHHLTCLRNCGVVSVRKNGKYSVYSINGSEIREIVKMSINHVNKYSKSILACDIIKEPISVEH
ncbi:transcriptional regulator [Sulfolobales archaeon HS-7]|nr:transcriptional regulator [Sulfolobales archaeon HS-7]